MQEHKFLNLGPRFYLRIFGLEFKKKLLSYLKSPPKFCAKLKKYLFWVFRASFFKIYCHIWYHNLEFALLKSLVQKVKCLNSTKNIVLGYFWVWIYQLIVIFEINEYPQICEISWGSGLALLYEIRYTNNKVFHWRFLQ